MTRKYNEGSWVTCLPGFHNGSNRESNFGGRGYIEGYTFKIQNMKQPTKGFMPFQMPDIANRGWCYFPDDVSCGVYEIALRSATQEEIDNALQNFTCQHQEADKDNKRCHKECGTCAQHRFTLKEWLKENPPFGGPYKKQKQWTDDDLRKAFEAGFNYGNNESEDHFNIWLDKYKNK